MLNSKYQIQWVGRCVFDDSDKVWGWFYYGENDDKSNSAKMSYKNAYVFWARTGKTLSFKRHDNRQYDLNRMKRQKIDRKYEEITVDEFCSLWDDINGSMTNKFVTHLLADNI